MDTYWISVGASVIMTMHGAHYLFLHETYALLAQIWLILLV